MLALPQYTLVVLCRYNKALDKVHFIVYHLFNKVKQEAIWQKMNL